MSKLNLEMFTSVDADEEAKQYRILAALQNSRKQFKSNRLYPELAELINLHTTLTELQEKLNGLRDEFPKEIKDLDLENKQVIYETLGLEEDQIKPLQSLIEWAEPHIKEVIDEGVAIYEFVNERLEVETVGIVPGYLNEGYFFVPDNTIRELKLYLYEMSLFTSTQQQYRSLKTSYLKSVETTFLEMEPGSVKLKLMDQRSDLPNPATYAFKTDLEFPYEETIFPVAKRKLMQQLSKTG